MDEITDPKWVVGTVVAAVGGLFTWLQRRERKLESAARLEARGDQGLTAQLLKELSEVREGFRKRIDDLEEDLDNQRVDFSIKLEQQRKECQDREDALRKDMNEMISAAGTYRNTIGGLNSKIEALQAENRAQERRIKTLESQIVEMGGEPRNGRG